MRDVLGLPALEPEGGAYSAWVRSTGVTSASLDAARLLLVDHAPELQAYVHNAEVLLGTRTAAQSARLADGTDVTPLLGGSSPEPWVARDGSTLTLELGPLSTGELLLLEACRGDAPGLVSSSGIQVQVPDGADWRTVAGFVPRRNFDPATLDTRGSGTLRLLFESEAKLRFAGRLARSAATPTTHWAPLQSAQDTRRGDVKGAVSGSDSVTSSLGGTDSLRLRFEVPPLGTGQARACFLWVEGTLGSSRRASEGRAQAGGDSRPATFQLLPSRPNPFRHATVIPFALPQGSLVRVEVFDVQGRRVQLVAQGYYPAGYHVVQWEGREAAGQRAAPGVYLYRLQAGAFRAQRRMVLLSPF